MFSARQERTAFAVLALLVWLLVAWRAWLLPLVHDEARTFFVYVQSGRFLPYLSHWDAGNHVLATAFAWFTTSLAGLSTIGLRLFSVLAFPLHAWYGWRMRAWIGSPMLGRAFLIAWIGTPFLLEFFSLFRGYGGSLAFLAMGVFHLVESQKGALRQHLSLTLLAFLLATWCTLSLTLIWGMVLVVLLLPILRHQPRFPVLVPWVLLGVLPWLFTVQYGRAMSERGLLYYGTDKGLFSGTLPSLLTPMMGSGDPAWCLLVAVIFGACFVLVALRVRAHGTDALQSALVLIGLLLLAELVGRWLLFSLFDTPYPSDRTALHLVPLFLLLLALSIDQLLRHRPRWSPLALVLLAFPLFGLVKARTVNTLNWPEESISQELYAMVEQRAAASDRPLLVGGYRQMTPVWDLEALMAGSAVPPMDPNGHPAADLDLLLIDTTYFTTPEGYRTIATSRSGRQVLKERLRPLRLTLLGDTAMQREATNDEFVEVWHSGAGLSGLGTTVLEFSSPVRSAARSLNLDLVIELRSGIGEVLHYDRVELRGRSLQWTGDTLHFMRRVPDHPEAVTMVAYLYNPERAIYALPHVRVALHRMDRNDELRPH